MATAIFLGAGASKAAGAPLQSEIFKVYFSDFPNEITLSNFFGLFFDSETARKIVRDKTEEIVFPTFEEALGIIDLAHMRGETLNWSGKYSSQEEYPGDWDRNTRDAREKLIWMMGYAIDEGTRNGGRVHVNLAEKLSKEGYLNKDKVIFITSNYDLLMDKALITLYPQQRLNFGVSFHRVEESKEWKPSNRSAVKLLKIHGSLNWLYCPICNNLKLKNVSYEYLGFAIDEFYLNQVFCGDCKSFRTPIIVPPTYYKNTSNVFLSTVWNKADNALRNVTRLIFCGYSFPEADMHIKYLMKRAQLNRKKGDFSVVVFNHYLGKDKRVADEEEIRYKRFFGENVVLYTRKSFEEFVIDPCPYLV